jgi:uncharacterized protein (DUF3820 family)
MKKKINELLMPFGKYEGCKINDLPAKELKWLYDNSSINSIVKLYIDENKIKWETI